jgi:hypothetical protein
MCEIAEKRRTHLFISGSARVTPTSSRLLSRRSSPSVTAGAASSRRPTAKAFASGLGRRRRTGPDGALLSILSSPAYIAWARDLLGASTRLWAYITIQLDADRHKARAAARPMIARFLGVHGEHPITRVAGMQPERARAFRSGWMSGHPRVDLITEVDLDTYCAAGNIDDVRGYLAAQSAAGLDVAVLRDVGTPDAAHQLAEVLALSADRDTRSAAIRCRQEDARTVTAGSMDTGVVAGCAGLGCACGRRRRPDDHEGRRMAARRSPYESPDRSVACGG